MYKDTHVDGVEALNWFGPGDRGLACVRVGRTSHQTH